MSTLQPGDVVRLRGGTMKMTIEQVAGAVAKCRVFGREQAPKVYIAVAQLEKDEAPLSS